MSPLFRHALKLSAALLFSSAAFADEPIGEIKVCRYPGIIGLTDRSVVEIPITGTYTGQCDKHGENCRSFVVTPLSSTSLIPGKNACATIKAKLTQSDEHPLKRGDQLAPQWSLAGFTAKTTVTKDFK